MTFIQHDSASKFEFQNIENVIILYENSISGYISNVHIRFVNFVRSNYRLELIFVSGALLMNLFHKIVANIAIVSLSTTTFTLHIL